jgi:2'-5' RNA ligase
MSSAATLGGDESLRLFLALRLPGDVLDALERWGDGELSQGRRVPREHLHVTLAFLGARPARELPVILDVLRSAVAARGPFPLEPSGYRETRSVGMVVLGDPTGGATRLARDLHDRLEQIGVYRRETRTWLPHITVLRFRDRPRLCPSPPAFEAFAPSDAAAFLSRLHPSGARYEVLGAVSLGSPTGQSHWAVPSGNPEMIGAQHGRQERRNARE